MKLGLGLGLGLSRRRVQPAGGVLLYDTFTDVDGTLIQDHTPDVDAVGGGWEADPNSAWEIQGNRLECISTPDANQNYVVADAGSADGTYEWHHAGQGDQGVYLRFADVNNTWFVWINGGDLTLWERTSGTFTQRAQQTGSLSTPYDGVATLNGTTIEVTVGGSTVTYNLATAHQAATKFGCRGEANTYFDNLKVSVE